jgi:alpha-glucosidase
MPGTPFMYYGEELGMRNAQLRYRDLRDPYTKRFWPFRPGRDPARTPMQWDASRHAGFTTGQPWLPVSPEYSQRNVDQEARDPRSLLSFYKMLIQRRRASPALSRGECSLVNGAPDDCLIYQRVANSGKATIEKMLVVLNCSEREVEFTLPKGSLQGRLLVSTNYDAEKTVGSSHLIRLGPNEGRLMQLPH